MADPNLGPPKITGGGPSIDDEAKELKRGRWPLLVGVGSIFVMGLVAVAWWLGRSDSGGATDYRALGQQINGMKQEHFDAFWICALPGAQLNDLHNDQDLRYNINKRASGAPRAYARHVRDDCLVKLNEHEQPRGVVVPPDLQTQIADLDSSVHELRTAWTAYITELDHLGTEPYVAESMDPHLNKIAKGWFDYRVAHGAINKNIGTHIH